MGELRDPSSLLRWSPPRIWSPLTCAARDDSPIGLDASWRTAATGDATSDPRGLCEKTGWNHFPTPTPIHSKSHPSAPSEILLLQTDLCPFLTSSHVVTIHFLSCFSLPFLLTSVSSSFSFASCDPIHH